jgi:hypothetical protein
MVRDGVKRSFRRKSRSQLKSAGSMIKEARRAVSNGNYSVALAAVREAEKFIGDTKILARGMQNLKDKEKKNSNSKTTTKLEKAINAKDRKLKKLERNLEKAKSKRQVDSESKKKIIKNSKTLELELEDKDE